MSGQAKPYSSWVGLTFAPTTPPSPSRNHLCSQDATLQCEHSPEPELKLVPSFVGRISKRTYPDFCSSRLHQMHRKRAAHRGALPSLDQLLFGKTSHWWLAWIVPPFKVTCARALQQPKQGGEDGLVKSGDRQFRGARILKSLFLDGCLYLCRLIAIFSLETSGCIGDAA